jgi:hypothetical protein
MLTDKLRAKKAPPGKPEDASISYVNSLFLLWLGRYVGQVIDTTPDRGIGRTPPGNMIAAPAVDAAGRQPFAVNSLDEDPGYLLGQCPMFACRAPAQRLF